MDSLRDKPVRRGPGGVPVPSGQAQLPLPMETKEKPGDETDSVRASKKKIKVPAYVRKHLNKTAEGEPLLYITQAPNQGSGVNISRHKYEIKRNFLKEEKERLKKMGRDWDTSSDEIKKTLEEVAERKAVKTINSWINDQRGADTVWVKGDPQYEKDELIKKAQNSVAYRAWAPIEALIFPQQTEVITKTDVGKTFQQMNDFEGPLGWLAYVGRFAPSTLVATTIAGGGWGTPEQIKAIKGGKDILSYTPDLGDWITDHAENMGLISKETSNHWWTNAIVGGVITVPIMLAEPDILTPVLAGAGMLAGGPVGAAGGFLASKGAKGLKALPVINKLNSINSKATKAKKVLAKVSGESEELKVKEAQKVIQSMKGSTGRVLRNNLATVIATNPTSAKLSRRLGKTIDEVQSARKAAPETVEKLDKIDDLTEALEKGTVKEEDLVNLIRGNEEAVLEYYQSKNLANKLLNEELQVNKRLANNYSQFKPKQQNADEYRKLTDDLNDSYTNLMEVERKINTSGVTDDLMAQRKNIMLKIRAGQKLLSKSNAEQALQIASKRAESAASLAAKSEKDLVAVNKLVDAAGSADTAEKISDLRKGYKDSKYVIDNEKTSLGADVLYDALESTLDDMIESTTSLKNNLGTKAKDYGVPELKSSLKTLRATDKVDEVVTLFDRSFGAGEFRSFVERSGTDNLKALVDGTAQEIDPDTYRDLQFAIKNMVQEAAEKQKSDLGIKLGEQILEESGFIKGITNLVGKSFMAKGAELFKDFKNPARKKYGSSAEDIVSSGRSRDSLAKRSQSEVGTVFTAKVDTTSKNFLDSKADVLENAISEIQGFLDPANKETMGEYASSVIKFMNKKGGSLELEDERKLLQKFLDNPDDKIVDLITENSIRRLNLKNLMTETDAVPMGKGQYTMTNIGKSSWWDLSKSWWRRSAVVFEKGAIKKAKGEEPPEALDETLKMFIRTFNGSDNTLEAAETLQGIGIKAARELLEDPDISFIDFTKGLRKKLGEAAKKPGVGFKVAAENDRLLAMQATLLSAASSQERAMFDLLRRTGGFDAQDVTDWSNFIAGKGGSVESLNKVYDIARRYGIPVSRDTYNNAQTSTSALLKTVEVTEGKFALVPSNLIDSIADNLDRVSKELAEFNPVGDQPGKMLVNGLSSVSRLWRTSITTGLFLPNPVHFTNIFFGNFSQIWASEDFSTAVRVTAQTLKPHVKYFGGKVDDILVENQAKYGNNRALASTHNATLNPHVNGFFDRRLAKDTDKIYDPSGKLIGTWGEVRESAAKNGVLSSFAGTDIREALAKSLKKRVEGGPLKRAAGKIYDEVVKGDAYSKFAETIEQRQRVALYLDLITRKGMDPKQAAENVKKALYDWDAPLSKLEADGLNNVFLFWRFWKLSLGQAIRHVSDPFVKPPTSTTDLVKYSLFQKSPISRTLAQSRLAMAAPELAYDKQMSDLQDRIEDGTATDKDRYMALLSMVYPSWRKGGNKVFLYNYPLDAQSTDQYARVFGKDVTHGTTTMPGLTMLDTYGMVFSTIGNLSAVAATSGRLATGIGDKDDVLERSDLLQNVTNLFIDPLEELANPAVESVLEELKDSLMGKSYEHRQVKTKLKPSEQYTIGLLGKLLSSGLLEYKVGDDSNTVYADKRIMDLYRLSPVLGTQISRTFDPFIEASEKQGYAEGLMHVIRQLSGIGKTYSYDPEKELNRLTYKFKDESQKSKQQKKYKPLGEKPE